MSTLALQLPNVTSMLWISACQQHACSVSSPQSLLLAWRPWCQRLHWRHTCQPRRLPSAQPRRDQPKLHSALSQLQQPHSLSRSLWLWHSSALPLLCSHLDGQLLHHSPALLRHYDAHFFRCLLRRQLAPLQRGQPCHCCLPELHWLHFGWLHSAPGTASGKLEKESFQIDCLGEGYCKGYLTLSPVDIDTFQKQYLTWSSGPAYPGKIGQRNSTKFKGLDHKGKLPAAMASLSTRVREPVSEGIS